MNRKILAAAVFAAAALLALPAVHLVAPAQSQVSCPTALPAATNFTGGSVTEGQYKTAQSNLVAYLSCLFGTNGTVATLQSTLGLATVAFSGSYADLSNTPATIPPGTIFSYAGASAPTGYLMANGQCVSSTTFAPLLASIGAGYGSCSAGNFAVPDLRGRAIFGADNMGGASAANRLQVSTNLTTTSGSTAATVASGSGVAAGQVITATSVPTGTTVASITGTAVTLSANAGATGTNAARFSPLGDAQALGQAGGAISHAMTVAELVAHSHTASSSSSFSGNFNGDVVLGSGTAGEVATGSPSGSTGYTPSGSVSTSTTVNSTGGGAAMSTQSTGMILNWIIKTSGKRLAPANDRWPAARAA
jgi:microcystin-dependent protein